MCTNHIQLIKYLKPIASPPYRLTPEKKYLVKKELEEMLQMGIIEEIKAEHRDAKSWTFPIVLVSKPEFRTRLCIDFRKVHKYTDANPHLPCIEDLFERVGLAKFLTKFDMTRAYWQIL